MVEILKQINHAESIDDFERLASRSGIADW
jgi:hypothetical protein